MSAAGATAPGPMARGTIRVGIGGWTYQPWRGAFYPDGLRHDDELGYASRRVTSIEINGTYYRLQKRDSFLRWHDETPDDFVFAVKGPRHVTNRRVLAEAEASLARFFDSGVAALGSKLGPINWQFLATKAFDPADFEAFLTLLPASIEGVALRHAVEVRHPGFNTPVFTALLRAHGVAAVYTDSEAFPQIADPASPFVYARLQRASEAEANGYPSAALQAWADRARRWAAGGHPEDLPTLPGDVPPGEPRDVFLYMINGFKPKAPAAAMALVARLQAQPAGGGAG